MENFAWLRREFWKNLEIQIDISLTFLPRRNVLHALKALTQRLADFLAY